jgi:hypothetical protein
LAVPKNRPTFALTKTNTMAYSPKFKWNDLLVLEFAKLSTMGSYGIFEDTRTLEEKLNKFKQVAEKKIKDERRLRILIGKRGMNEDGSRFYYDKRGVKWTIKREVLDNTTYYVADSEKNECVREQFLSDTYSSIDKITETEKKKISENFERFFL